MNIQEQIATNLNDKYGKYYWKDAGDDNRKKALQIADQILSLIIKELKVIGYVDSSYNCSGCDSTECHGCGSSAWEMGVQAQYNSIIKQLRGE